MSIQPFRSPSLLSRQASRLLVIDMQERLLRVMRDAQAVTAQCELLLQAAACLSVPSFATEQYPQGLGATVEPLRSRLGTIPAKLRFSAASAWDWAAAADGTERRQIVLAGIETHVCVLQTALDLQSAGFDVYVVADAVTSRHEADQRIALERMRDQGVVVTSAEAVLFEWCEAAGTDEFRQISSLVKSRRSV